IYNDGVLAPHFGDNTFNPNLSGARLRGELVDAQADIAGARERNETRFRVLYQNVANHRSAPHAQAETARRKSGFEKNLSELMSNDRRLARRLDDDRI